MSKKPVVVHVINPYLFHTGSWIYSQLTGLRDVANVVFTYKRENIEQFPFNPIYCYKDFRKIEKICNRLYRLYMGDNSGLFFSRYIKKHSPRLIHAHMGYEAAKWCHFAEKMKLPLISTFYGQDVSKLGKIPYWYKRYQKLFNYGDIFLAEGSNLKRQLVELGCDEKKVIVQHLGVNLEDYNTKDYSQITENKKIVILQVSTFREKKGIEYSLEAISILKQRFDNIEFRLIGGGDNNEAEQRLISLINKFNISDIVKMLGIKTHKKTLEEMYNSDIFLHPSVTAVDGDNEGGAPVGVIEASAMALPVVSTLHADIPEVIINNETGFLANERDAVGVANKLDELIRDKQLRQKFGEKGRIHVSQNYNLKIQLEKLDKIYQDLINGN